jgi:hypothetical protein
MRRLTLTFALLFAADPLLAQREWKLVEDLRIGAGDGQASLAFVGPITVTANGNIFVADVRPVQIKLFSPKGAFVRAVGRDGGGPGEYREITGLFTMPDGNVMAIDATGKRFIVYGADGRALRTNMFGSFGREWDGTARADGSLLVPIRVFPSGWKSGTREPPKALQRVLPDGKVADTLRFPGCAQQTPPGDSYVQVPRPGPNGQVGYMQFRVPYLAASQTVFAPDGTAWCAPTDVYSIFHFRVGSPDTLSTIRLNIPAPPIPDSGRRMLDSWAARASNAADITWPKAQPVISAIRVDDSNRLWVRRTATPDKAPSFDLYDPQGKPLGTVTTTLRWDRIPLVVGDYAYGMVTGDDDIQYVVRAKLR